MRSVRDNNRKGARVNGNPFSKQIFYLFVVLCFLFSISISAQDINLPPRPDPPRLVNDMVGMLTYNESHALEHKLVAYSDSTSTQIAVVIISSLQGAEIAQYATELATKWGIGIKGKDNGVILLISKTDHKIFIATGRGVEASLPDITVKGIIEHIIKPRFKAGHYYEGINAATDRMMASLSGQFVNDDRGKDTTEARPQNNAKWIALVIVIIFVLIIFFGGGGGQTYNGTGSVLPWFLLGGMMGGGFGGGRDGDFGGGDSGGFGGFGGGDFGGGGAGGDW